MIQDLYKHDYTYIRKKLSFLRLHFASKQKLSSSVIVDMVKWKINSYEFVRPSVDGYLDQSLKTN